MSNENGICKDCDFEDINNKNVISLKDYDPGCVNFGLEDCSSSNYSILRIIIYSYIIFKILSMKLLSQTKEMLRYLYR